MSRLSEFRRPRRTFPGARLGISETAGRLCGDRSNQHAYAAANSSRLAPGRRSVSPASDELEYRRPWRPRKEIRRPWPPTPVAYPSKSGHAVRQRRVRIARSSSCRSSCPWRGPVGSNSAKRERPGPVPCSHPASRRPASASPSSSFANATFSASMSRVANILCSPRYCTTSSPGGAAPAHDGPVPARGETRTIGCRAARATATANEWSRRVTPGRPARGPGATFPLLLRRRHLAVGEASRLTSWGRLLGAPRNLVRYPVRPAAAMAVDLAHRRREVLRRGGSGPGAVNRALGLRISNRLNRPPIGQGLWDRITGGSAGSAAARN